MQDFAREPAPGEVSAVWPENFRRPFNHSNKHAHFAACVIRQPKLEDRFLLRLAVSAGSIDHVVVKDSNGLDTLHAPTITEGEMAEPRSRHHSIWPRSSKIIYPPPNPDFSHHRKPRSTGSLRRTRRMRTSKRHVLRFEARFRFTYRLRRLRYQHRRSPQNQKFEGSSSCLSWRRPGGIPKRIGRSGVGWHSISTKFIQCGYIPSFSLRYSTSGSSASAHSSYPRHASSWTRSLRCCIAVFLSPFCDGLMLPNFGPGDFSFLPINLKNDLQVSNADRTRSLVSSTDWEYLPSRRRLRTGLGSR